jgi:uncharacterized protein YbcI
MADTHQSMSHQVAAAVRDNHAQCTGRTPRSVTVVQSDDTLVVTLHDALSPAERELAQSPAGAAQVQEFHRQLFLNTLDSLREEIRRITGVAVREAAVEFDAPAGAVVHAFASGAMVQVFQLVEVISGEAWNARDGRSN